MNFKRITLPLLVLLCIFLLSVPVEAGKSKGCSPRYVTCYLDYDRDGFSSATDLTVTYPNGLVKKYPRQYVTDTCSNPELCNHDGFQGHYFQASQLRQVLTDCDDNNPFVNPEMEEVCDGLDNNCNGLIDNSPGESLATHLGGQDKVEFENPYFPVTEVFIPILNERSISTMVAVRDFCKAKVGEPSNAPTDSIEYDDILFDGQSTPIPLIIHIKCENTENGDVYEGPPILEVSEPFNLPVSPTSAQTFCQYKELGRADSFTTTPVTKEGEVLRFLNAFPQINNFIDSFNLHLPSIEIYQKPGSSSQNPEFFSQFSLTQDALSQVTCVPEYTVRAANHNVCNFQTDFTYRCVEDGAFRVDSFRRTQTIGGRTNDHIYFPNIYFNNLSRTKEQPLLTSPGSGVRDNWDDATLQYFVDMFNPNKRQIYCEGQNCLFHWLDGAENDLENNFEFENFCCGSLEGDLGRIFPYNDINNICVMNPSGQFEWVAQGQQSLITRSGAPHFFTGNIYEITQGRRHFDLLLGENELFTCSPPTLPLSSSTYTNKNERQKVILEMANRHEYLCHQTLDGRFQFAECRGEASPYNTIHSRSHFVNEQSLFSRPSLLFGESLFTIASFERVPGEPVFVNQNPTFLTQSIDSSIKFKGDRSLRLQVEVGEDTGRNITIETQATLGKNVANFDSLNGYVRFETIGVLDIKINDKTFRLEDYVTSDIILKEWLYFSIPLTDITSIETLSFIAPTTVKNFHKAGRYIYYIDELYLGRDSYPSYCGRIVDPISSKQQFTFVNTKNTNKHACEGAGHTWTGTQCCGDGVGSKTYVDSLALCFEGNPVPLGSRFEPISFKVNGITIETVCTDERSHCTIQIPRLEGALSLPLTLTNTNPNYNVTFTSNGLNETTNLHDSIKVTVSKYLFAHLNDEDAGALLCGVEADVLPFFRTYGIPYTSEIASRLQTGVCSVSDFFTCGANGWSSTYAIDGRVQEGLITRDQLAKTKQVPSSFTDDVLISSGCCPHNFCWNGNFCVADQKDDPRGTLHFLTGDLKGYRCFEGEWVGATQRFSPGGIPGFCPDDSMCFYNPSGTFSEDGSVSANPQCINDGEYRGQRYCNKGIFESRTKKLFEQMQAEFGSPRFTLNCGPPENVLNVIGNVEGRQIQQYIRGSPTHNCQVIAGTNNCMNNFCVLSSSQGIAFGTTLNQALDAVNLSAQELFAIPSISSCKEEGDLTFCSRSDLDATRWYFDSSLQTLINSGFSKTLNPLQRIFDTLKQFFFGGSSTPLLTLRYSELASAMNLEQFIDIGANDVFYYAQDGNNKVIAVNGNLQSLTSITLDGRPSSTFSYVGIKYQGYSGLCDYLKDSTNYRVECHTEGSDTYVFILSTGAIPIWDDLTGKLRIFESS